MLHSIALALLPQVPYDTVVGAALTAADVMTMPAKDLKELGAFESADEAEVLRKAALEAAAEEAQFAEAKHLRVLTPLDPDYPMRMAACTDAMPRMISVCGTANLNIECALAMVGTRKCSPYGTKCVDDTLAALKERIGAVSIISGLAYGIDAAAHRAALRLGMTTIAVVAHGLSMIYPASHHRLASEIVEAGGAIVSQYTHKTKPFRGNFLQRNAVIAMLSDAVMVVESRLRGGALNTAAHALDFDRLVFAVPGRISDENSEGCNHLIARQSAQIFTGVGDLISATRWPEIVEAPKKSAQGTLFPELTDIQKAITQAMHTSTEPLQVDEIVRITALPVHQVMPEIFNLEFSGILLRWPGNRFQLAKF